jgi:hypothetical protein
MKSVIKLFLLFGIIVFGLMSYRIFTFDKGRTQTDFDGTYTEIIKLATDIEKVEYYKKIAKKGDYEYKLYIATSDTSYLINATQSDIDALTTLGLVKKSYSPKLIKPIPFYIDAIVFLLILFIPFERKKQNKNRRD